MSEVRLRPLAVLAPVPALAVLAAFAAFAPARVRLLVLFPAVVGIVAGAIVVYFASRRGVESRFAPIAAVLVPITLVAYGAGSFFVWRHAVANEIAANLLAQPGGRAILDRFRLGSIPADESEAEFVAAYRERMAPPPTSYLTERLKGLPLPMAMPWSALVASGEFLVGCVAGVVTAHLLGRSVTSSRSETRP